MSFDSTCKYLAEKFPQDFATWLLGQSITLTKLEPTELSLEPIRADSLIFLESDNLIVHIEFQVDPIRDRLSQSSTSQAISGKRAQI